jgi:hypothetical protein
MKRSCVAILGSAAVCISRICARRAKRPWKTGTAEARHSLGKGRQTRAPAIKPRYALAMRHHEQCRCKRSTGDRNGPTVPFATGLGITLQTSARIGEVLLPPDAVVVSIK